MIRRIFGREAWYVEISLASVSISWGLWLLAPWEAFPTSPTFAVMNQLGPESAWGSLLVGGGVMLLLGLYRGSYLLRRQGLGILGFSWLAVWSALVMGNWRGTSTPIYIHLSLMAFFARLRLTDRIDR